MTSSDASAVPPPMTPPSVTLDPLSVRLRAPSTVEASPSAPLVEVRIVFAPSVTALRQVWVPVVVTAPPVRVVAPVTSSDASAVPPPMTPPSVTLAPLSVRS